MNSPLLSPKQVDDKLKAIHSVLPEDKLIVKHIALQIMADNKYFTEADFEELVSKFLHKKLSN